MRVMFNGSMSDKRLTISIMSASTAKISEVKKLLSSEFDITDYGDGYIEATRYFEEWPQNKTYRNICDDYKQRILTC